MNNIAVIRLKVLHFAFDVRVFYKFICKQRPSMIEDDHKSSFISSGKTNSHGLNILRLFALDIHRINTKKRTIALPSKFVYNDMLMVLKYLFRKKERKHFKRTCVLRSVPGGVKSLLHVVPLGPSSKTELFLHNRTI